MLKGTIFVGYQNLQNVCAKLPSSSNIPSSQNWHRCSEMTPHLPPKLLISHWLPVLSGSNPEVAYVTTQGVPLPPYPPPPKKVDPPTTSQKKKEENGQGPEVKKEIKKEKKRTYLCESSLGGPACWRAFIRKRLVRHGLQQQYLMRFSDLVKFMYARNIK